MICMSMGVEHRIEGADVLAYRLLAKIRRGVDDYRPPVVFNQYRRAGSFVLGIGGVADRAVAPNRRHAHRRAAAQHGQRRLHFAAGTCCAFLAMALVTSTYAIRIS